MGKHQRQKISLHAGAVIGEINQVAARLRCERDKQVAALPPVTHRMLLDDLLRERAAWMKPQADAAGFTFTLTAPTPAP